jgi:hypothetical protein
MDPEVWPKAYEAEKTIMSLRGCVVSMEMDRQCGKMRLEVIEPKAVLEERKKAVNHE